MPFVREQSGGTGNEETKSFTVPKRSTGTATYNITFSSEIVAIKSYSDQVARTFSISFSGNLLTFTTAPFDQYSYNVTVTCFVK